MRCRTYVVCVLAVLPAACQVTTVPVVDRAQRTLASVGTPERVFDRPVAELVAELSDATLSTERGRVGNELVFWAYDMPEGEKRWLYGCALVPEVDCLERASRVCPAGETAEVLLRREESGAVRHLDCQLVGQAAPGELHPNCVDNTETQPIEIGLLACGR